MTPYEYKKIDTNLIDIPARHYRRIKAHRVDTLVHDIAANSLQQPIIVVEEKNGRFTLQKGLQRLEAIKTLKLSEIDARVTPVACLREQEGRLHALLATLNREDFTALERAEALSELKTIYETLHPQTKKGGDRKSQAAKNKAENQSEIFSFSQSAAEATGLSVRSIEIAVAIVNGLAIATRERLRGTQIEKRQSDLRLLSEVDPEVQHKALDLLLSQHPQALNVLEAIALAMGRKADRAAELSYQRYYERVTKLPKQQRYAFFDMSEKHIREWAEERGWFA